MTPADLRQASDCLVWIYEQMLEHFPNDKDATLAALSLQMATLKVVQLQYELTHGRDIKEALRTIVGTIEAATPE